MKHNKINITKTIIIFACSLAIAGTASAFFTGFSENNVKYADENMIRPIKTHPAKCEVGNQASSIFSETCNRYWDEKMKKECGSNCLEQFNKKINKFCENNYTEEYEQEKCKCEFDSIYQSFGEKVYSKYLYFLSIDHRPLANILLEEQPANKLRLFRDMKRACKFPTNEKGENIYPENYDGSGIRETW